MNRIVLIVELFFVNTIGLYSQVNSASELVSFSSMEFNVKSKGLINNGWKLIEPLKNTKDYRGVKSVSSKYSKKINGVSYKLLIEKKIYPDSDTDILWTTLYLSNGDTFDKLEEEFEKLGFRFKPIIRGKLLATSIYDDKTVVTFEIKNIDNDSSMWSYEIKIVVNPS